VTGSEDDGKNKLEADYKDKVIHIEMTDLLIKEDEGS